MMIHSEIVGKSRKLYYCDACTRRIAPGSSYVRCYGMAEPGDKPYAVRYHLDCVDTSDIVRRDRRRGATHGVCAPESS